MKVPMKLGICEHCFCEENGGMNAVLVGTKIAHVCYSCMKHMAADDEVREQVEARLLKQRRPQ